MARSLVIDRDLSSAGRSFDVPSFDAAADPLRIIPELHSERSGRLDAERIACYFAVPLTAVALAIGKKVAAVHKTPDADSLQPGLKVWYRIAAGLSALTASPVHARIWLNAPNRDLGDETPISFMKRGEANIIAELVEDILVGQPG
jgi:hypothetical protein